jgi:hypothetical protein
MAVAMVYMATTETRLGGSDRENTLAYYGAEAAMEQMVADLAAIYTNMQSPTQADIDALEATQPSLPGVEYKTYDLGTMGTPVTKTLSSGPNAGLLAIVTPISLNVTARRPQGEEVSMSRDVEIAQIPVFQFARFSETDLQYEPDPQLEVTGRLHTNGHLYVSTWTGPMIFHAKVTAVKDVIRDELYGGGAPGSGKVYMSTAASGCSPNTSTNCRELKVGQGSRLGGPTDPKNPNWPTISTGLPPSGYNGYVLNGDTGAKRLDLSFVQPGSGLGPIEIIRRPPPGEPPATLVSQARLYNKAQIRVLLSDDPADLPGGATDAENVFLYNDAGSAYPSGVPVPGVSGGNTHFATGQRSVDSDWVKPYKSPAYADGDNWPLLASYTNTGARSGYLRVEVRKADGTYMPVTKEWLELGFARGLNPPNSESGVTNGVHPNAILIMQMVRDKTNDGTPDTSTYGGASQRNYWYPINLYDPREGNPADNDGLSGCPIGGIMNAVEIDAQNLRKWLFGAIGTSGNQVEDATQNGFVLYFSDRRGMLPNPNAGNVITGEYGWEDFEGSNANGSLDANEDVNGNGILDTWGKANLGDGFYSSAQNANNSDDHPYNKRPPCVTGGGAARKNRVSGARHVLKLVNGSLGNLPTKRSGSGGFTVASENSTYVVGNYNANNAGFGNPHSAAAIITDRLTMLSKNWKDIYSFESPESPYGRRAADTYWRVAMLAGMQLNDDTGFRNIEDWSGLTWYFMTSEVTLYFVNQGVGLSHCCKTQYKPPTRILSFDTDFLNTATMPPATPMLRDVVNIGFRQVFRAD